MFWMYASAIIADAGAPLASPSVCNISLQTEKNFIPLLF
jgi:hypothetical protein